MDKKTDLVFEYFEKKYGFDIEKLGIDKYQIQHIFQNNHRYFDKKDSIKILILHIEKMIDTQIKDNKKKIISNSFLDEKPKKEKYIQKKEEIIEKKVFNNILLDSKDRDFIKFKYPSFFEFKLNKKIKTELIIKDIILKTTTKENDSSDNLESIPYLILDLSLNKNEGTNKNLKDSTAILTNYNILGEFRYYNLNKKIKLEKEVDKISLKIKKPNGEIYNFGNINNTSIYSVVFINMEGV